MGAVAIEHKELTIQRLDDDVFGTDEEIIEADDIMIVVQKVLAQMRAMEAIATGDERLSALGVVFH